MRIGRTNIIRNHLTDMKLRPRKIKALVLHHTANKCVCDYLKILRILPQIVIAPEFAIHMKS